MQQHEGKPGTLHHKHGVDTGVREAEDIFGARGTSDLIVTPEAAYTDQGLEKL